SEATVGAMPTCLDLLDKGLEGARRSRRRVVLRAGELSIGTPANGRRGRHYCVPPKWCCSSSSSTREARVQTGSDVSEVEAECRNPGVPESSKTPCLHFTTPSRLIQPFDPDVFVADNALRVVALQGEGAFAEFPEEIAAGLRALWFIVFKHLFPIHQHGDAAAFDDDFLGPPFIVARGRLEDVDEAIEAAGLDRVAVGVIDLRLEPGFGPTFRLVLGVKIN